MAPRILVTGSREWTNEALLADALAGAWDSFGNDPQAVLVSGACPTGADALAEQVWAGFGLRVERHPADWRTHGRAAGPIRNRQMVAAGADVCLAFPMPSSRGTRDCITVARAAGIPVWVIDPSEIVEDAG